MSDGKDDQGPRVSGSLGTMGVGGDRDGAGNAVGDVGSGVRLPSVSYAFIRANDHGSAHALYDVVECVPGRVNRVLARNVFYHDAFDISFALNARISLGRE